MSNLLLENVAKIQQAERLQQAEHNRFSASVNQGTVKINIPYLVLAVSGIALIVLLGL